MIEQPDLLGAVHTIGANGRVLSPDQQLAYNLVRDTPGGVTAEQVGAHLHSRRAEHAHPESEPCEWCDGRGKQVLGSKAVGPLVIRRKVSLKYELRDGSTPKVQRETAQLDGLPDWLAA